MLNLFLGYFHTCILHLFNVCRIFFICEVYVNSILTRLLLPAFKCTCVHLKTCEGMKRRCCSFNWGRRLIQPVGVPWARLGSCSLGAWMCPIPVHLHCIGLVRRHVPVASDYAYARHACTHPRLRLWHACDRHTGQRSPRAPLGILFGICITPQCNPTGRGGKSISEATPVSSFLRRAQTWLIKNSARTQAGRCLFLSSLPPFLPN